MKLLLITTLLLTGVLSHEQCGFQAGLERELAADKDGSFHKRIEESERNFRSERHKHLFNKMVRNENDRRGLQDGVFDGKGFSTSDYFQDILEIPVIVHVLYNNFETPTVSSLTSHERIQSQILRLNIDYQAHNDETLPSIWSPLQANYKMAFKLSEVRRDTSTKTEFNWDLNEFIDSKAGGSGNIEPEHYLNLYVAKSTDSKALGQCTWPTFRNEIDGCVISPHVFGDRTFKYIKDDTWKSHLNPVDDLGRTATHEIGHWLDLRHTCRSVPRDSTGNVIPDDGVCINNEDDGVLDTPKQYSDTSGCPSTFHYSCGNTQPDMYMNYMDYSEDHCMGLFTNGQLERSLAIFKKEKGTGRKELTDYQQNMKINERFVNDLYFRPLKTYETDEAEICGPNDHLISNHGKIYGDYYIYSCASTTNNKYVKVINPSNIYITTQNYDDMNCLLIIEDNRYLCWTKISFDENTANNMMTVDQLRTKLNEIFENM